MSEASNDHAEAVTALATAMDQNSRLVLALARRHDLVSKQQFAELRKLTEEVRRMNAVLRNIEYDQHESSSDSTSEQKASTVPAEPTPIGGRYAHHSRS